jgi:hypothetical protein
MNTEFKKPDAYKNCNASQVDKVMVYQTESVLYTIIMSPFRLFKQLFTV